MKVKVGIICREMFGGFSGDDVDVPQGSTARQAVEACLLDAAQMPPDHFFENVMCMADGANASWDAVLKDGSEVYALHKIIGG